MPQFLVEVYLSHRDADELICGVEGTLAAAVSAEGRAMRHLRSILVPGDETCLYLFEAADAEAVRAGCERAGIAVDRLVEAADVTPAPAAERGNND